MTLTRTVEGLLRTDAFTGNNGDIPANWTVKLQNDDPLKHFNIQSNAFKAYADATGVVKQVAAADDLNSTQGNQGVQITFSTTPVANQSVPTIVVRVGELQASLLDDYYLLYCTDTASKIYKCVNATYTELASTATTITSGDVLSFWAIGTSPNIALSAYKNGVALVSVTGQSDFASGQSGFRHDVWPTYSVIADNYIRTTHYNLVVTGLPTGYYAKVSGSSGTAKAAESSGTATVDTRPVIYALTGGTLEIYNGDPDAGGSLVDSTTGVYGGDTWAYSAAAARANRLALLGVA